MRPNYLIFKRCTKARSFKDFIYKSFLKERRKNNIYIRVSYESPIYNGVKRGRGENDGTNKKAPSGAFVVEVVSGRCGGCDWLIQQLFVCATCADLCTYLFILAEHVPKRGTYMVVSGQAKTPSAISKTGKILASFITETLLI